jgi:hypothetical protein
MTRKFNGLIIICVSLICMAGLLSCKKSTIKEQEPNNSFKTATPIELEHSARGFINSSDDRDFYSLKVPHAMVLSVELTGIKGVNSSIKVWRDADPPLLVKTIDDSRKSSAEAMANLALEAGTWYFSVQHGDRDARKKNTETPYTLNISYRDYLAEEREPNDTMNTAMELLPDNEITGYFSPAYNRANVNPSNMYREEDWFVLPVQLQDDTPMLMDVTLSKVNGVNSILALYDEAGNELVTVDNSTTSLGEEIRGMGIRHSGRYYIMVASKSYQSNHEEPYYLNTSVHPYNPNEELEPNDSIDRANELVSGQIRAAISRADDTDFFLYKNNDVTSLYRIMVNPLGNTDFTLDIYSKSKKKILSINNASTGEMELYPNFSATNDFYCAVTAEAVASDEDPGYQLFVENLGEMQFMEIEPNGTKEEATAVNGDEIRGYISQKQDRDYFLLKYDRRVKLECEIHGVKEGSIKVAVTDPLGFILKSVTVRGEAVETLTEMVDRRGYLIVDADKENFEHSYAIYLRGQN